MARLLVTGGAGFIGANFVHEWVERRPADRVVVLDALTYAGNKENLAPASGRAKIRFVHGDIRESALVERLLIEEKVDTIVHLAAESHVDRSIEGPGEFISTNVVGTYSLLQAARAAWLDSDNAPANHRFHHVSTDEVYGALGPKDPAFTETTPYAPNSPYSASKAAADHLVRSYHQTYGLQVTTSICSNNYGPYQYPEKLMPLTIINALEGKAIPVYGDGTNVRDWLYVGDHVRGIVLTIDHGQVGETYNLGGNDERSNIDIVTKICNSIDAAFGEDDVLAKRFPKAPAAQGGESSSLISFVADRPGHDWRYAIDTSRSHSTLGFAPRESLDQGLRKTLDWFLENERWWRTITNSSYWSQIENRHAKD